MTESTGATPAQSRGAVDLTQLQQQSPGSPAGGADGGSEASWVLTDMDQQGLQQLLEHTNQVPVIIHLARSATDDVSAQIDQALVPEIDARAGRIAAGRVNVDTHPEILQAFGGAQAPMVLAILGGQAMPLLNAPAPAEQIKALLDELNAVAVQNGLSGSVPPLVAAEADAEGHLPPHLQEAEDAVAAGDYHGAIAAYQRVLEQNPRDEHAKAGVARVELLQRTESMDAQQVRTAAAENPDAVQAQIDVADLDLLGGHVEDAFTRLVKFIASHFGDDRETARAHLVELYQIVGDHDPRVGESRKKLAMALF
ncbi:co-chaperone YbbN [Auritidibacter sp. NML100628]|uniref:co-chaperone YbbN n=1 Tax=Auritidibacter sp. NML100628 TaxID=2170742 RepID=UPI000D729845|nr:tetratricopeptide repeat protein [Auritidibacter sp. NML100628]PXA77522.1 thioredoxin [Auritidibacter sp. NML100628]